MLHDASLSKEALSDVLNTFDESLTVTIDGDETLSRAHFLDLDLQVVGNHVEYSTYRKPLCLYMYTPFNSCHPKHIFSGIIATELFRLLTTNSKQKQYEHHKSILFQKLRLRGYSVPLMYSVAARVEEDFYAAQQHGENSRIIPFKLPYADVFRRISLGKVLKTHFDLLAGSPCGRVVMCYTSNKNLFRLRYGRFMGA